jgi:branched-chain amino acid transport system permease protein
MELFLQQAANGIVLGMTYALVAIGLTLIYGIFAVVNMTQGALYMFGAYATYVLVRYVELNYFLAVPLAMLFVGGVGLLCERLSVSPLLGRHHAVFILSTFGLAVIMENLVMIAFGPQSLLLQSPIARTLQNFGNVITLSWQKVFLIAFGAVMLAAIALFLKRGRLGRAMRAVATDRDTASLMGINVRQIYRITFFIGAGMSGAAGALMGAVYSIEPLMGGLVLLKSFVVVIMGGMGSLPGALLGGLILGLAESLGGTYLTLEYKDAFGLTVMILVLLLRPQGLLGRGELR